MSEPRSAIYAIRWEILVIGGSLALSALVVLTIPNDFTEKMLEEQKEQKEVDERSMAEMPEESPPAETTGEDMMVANPSDANP